MKSPCKSRVIIIIAIWYYSGALQSQKAVIAYLKGKQLLPFASGPTILSIVRSDIDIYNEQTRETDVWPVEVWCCWRWANIKASVS